MDNHDAARVALGLGVRPGAAGETLGITLTLVSIGVCALCSVLTRRLILDAPSLTVLAQQAAALLVDVLVPTVVDLAGDSGWDLADMGAGSLLGAAASGVLY